MNIYDRVRSIQFPRAPFDLSHSHQGSYDMGYLYPVLAEEAVPGDTWKIGTQLVARALPLVAPIMHEVNIFLHYWFVPNRILWPKPDYVNNPPVLESGNWVNFITGGEFNDNVDVQPTWDPDTTDKTVGSLWDHFGHPLTDVTGFEPTAFHKRAYNLIYNENYRDQNLIDPVDLDSNTIKKRAWEKDYFTASLPWQQKGVSPALPIAGTTSAVWASEGNNAVKIRALIDGTLPPPNNNPVEITTGNPITAAGNVHLNATGGAIANAQFALGVPIVNMNNNTVDLSVATTFDIADLRTAIQIQRWLERNARTGTRYTEFLKAHYRANPRDDRLQRPEYIGGTRQPIVVSEVLQTNESTETSPQGNMAGHGISIGGDYAGTYRVLEHGWIIGIMSIMPRTMYTQGMTRIFNRKTRYDYYFPEFANLSEQAVLKAELYASNNGGENDDIFGYQGRYDELRQRNSRAVGLMRVTTGGLGHWNLARQFGSAPSLNQAFIEVESQTLKDRAWAVPSQPAFVVTVGNILKVNRPLPEVAEPGLIDHV